MSTTDNVQPDAPDRWSRLTTELKRAEAEVERLREVVVWVQEVHGIDDDKMPEFLARVNPPNQKASRQVDK